MELTLFYHRLLLLRWPTRQPCREAEYTEYRPLRLYVGTWNVNGKFPREDLTPWLAEGAYDHLESGSDAKIHMPDVYVVG